MFWGALEGRYGTTYFVVWGAGFGSISRTFCVPVKPYKADQLDLVKIAKGN